jgi:predicted amidohydrolase
VKRVLHLTDFKQANSQTHPDGWLPWSPREEIAPAFSVDPHGGRRGGGALAISGGGNPANFGAWLHTAPVSGGKAYGFNVRCRWTDVATPERSVVARLDWMDARGERLRPVDHAHFSGTEDGWTIMRHNTVAPENAAKVRIELGIRWTGMGRITWDDVELTELDALPVREVRVATVHHRPRETGSSHESIRRFCKILDAEAPGSWDIICLPEGASQVGSGLKYTDVAEPIPGPVTELLSASARRAKCYIVAGVYERVGPIVYNTAVLIDRSGAVIGKYRKTHLPQEEAEAGLMQGDEYPVFDVDFGRIGIMVCWDLQFPEPARALAKQGAEILFLPIWGGNEVLARARAIENHAYLVSSSYDMSSFVLDPLGQVRAQATADKPLAGATIDLAANVLDLPWLGNMRGRVWTERRTDLP